MKASPLNSSSQPTAFLTGSTGKRIKKYNFLYTHLLICLLLFLLCMQSLQAQYVTVAPGSYTSASTWAGGIIPPSGSSVIVAHAVTLASKAPGVSTLTVAAGGTLTLNTSASLAATNAVTISGGTLSNSGGALSVGTSGGGNEIFTLTSGTFNISSGTVTVNGNVAMVAGSFNMSGGNFTIDPNSGSAATSVATGTDIFSLSSLVSSVVNGGTITFVDPPYTGTGRTFAYTGNARSVKWEGNTMVFGGTVGINTAAGGTDGFNVDTRAGGSKGSYIRLGNVTVNGGSGTNRFLSGSTVSSNGFDIAGNLIINSGCEVRTFTGGSMLRISGNITNSGSYVDLAGVSFSQRLGANTVPQYVTTNGGGKFYNSLSKPTANFTNLVFNNTAGPVAITFNFGDGVVKDGAIFVSGNVYFDNGIVDIGTDNQFVFTLTASASRVAGALLRGTGPGGGAQMVKQYPVGASSFTYHVADNIGTYDYSPVTVNFSANDYLGRAVSVSVFDKVHSKMKTGGTPTDYLSRYWRIVGTPIGTSTAVITLKYLTEDIVGTESEMQLNKWDGSKWVQRTSVAGNNTLTINTTETTLAGGTLAEITGRYVPAQQKSFSDLAESNTTAVKVSLYPNPVKGGVLNLQLTSIPAGKYAIAVYNIGGQQVYSYSLYPAQGSSTQTINLPANLPAGIYTFLLRSEQGMVHQQKIMIEN